MSFFELTAALNAELYHDSQDDEVFYPFDALNVIEILTDKGYKISLRNDLARKKNIYTITGACGRVLDTDNLEQGVLVTALIFIRGLPYGGCDGKAKGFCTHTARRERSGTHSQS